MTINDLKQRVANLRTQAATQKAHLDLAERQLREREEHIRATYGVAPDQLSAELAKAEADIQQMGEQVLSILQAAGA